MAVFVPKMIVILLPFYFLCFVLSLTDASCLLNNGKFKKDLIFGVSTASYQIEGAWDEDGKGENIWDRFVHRVPSPIANNDTGDIACDSYHRWREDIHLAKALGIQYYRFSISWARILPTGYSCHVNQKGVQHYQQLIQEVVNCGMIPVVTLYHWDLPQQLYDDGLHWINPAVVDVFVDYCRFVIQLFPQVGRWITFNEPKQICHLGYGGNDEEQLAPGLRGSGILDYQCAYVVLKAHAAVYRMYKEEFPHYKAPMSLVIDCQWYEPETYTPADIAAAERQLQFECGLYYHPIFIGDWPPSVKARVAERSKKEHFRQSRLPQFTAKEIADIRGTHDYIGINHYYTYLAADEEEAPYTNVSYESDVRVTDSKKPSWSLSANEWAIVPWGVRKMLNWIRDNYGNHPILITEIGIADNGTTLDDEIRVDYYSDYFCEILEAIQTDGINMLGITLWSLLDNFEWTAGYTAHFGLYKIDFYNDPSLTRRPKKSAGFFKRVTRTRKLDCSSYKREWPHPSWGPWGKRPHIWN